jgi:hypothetical protein
MQVIKNQNVQATLRLEGTAAGGEGASGEDIRGKPGDKNIKKRPTQLSSERVFYFEGATCPSFNARNHTCRSSVKRLLAGDLRDVLLHGSFLAQTLRAQKTQHASQADEHVNDHKDIISSFR